MRNVYLGIYFTLTRCRKALTEISDMTLYDKSKRLPAFADCGAAPKVNDILNV